MRRWIVSVVLLLGLTLGSSAHAQPSPGEAGMPTSRPTPPTTAPASAPGAKLPHLQVDIKKKQVRVDCQALNVEMPLEFFCVVNGTNEHESVLRSPVKPSQLHLALLMIGLKPGTPVHYDDATDKWFAPQGPPLHIWIEYQKDGKTVRYPAYRCMRNVKTKKEMPPLTWIFTGSRIMEDGKYAADVTGYLVSVVNFDLTVIDIPEIASSANETLEWEYNPKLVPKTGTPVTMILEPAEHVEKDGKAAQ
jgi:hypothetical protein